MRKQGIFMGLLSGLMVLGSGIPVHAETFYGDDDWNVAFTSDREMVSSFSTADINDVVSGMQPGDNVIITLDLKNTNPRSEEHTSELPGGQKRQQPDRGRRLYLQAFLHGQGGNGADPF